MYGVGLGPQRPMRVRPDANSLDYQSSAEPYTPRTRGVSINEKLVKQIHDAFSRMDFSPAMAARLLTRMSPEIQEKLAAMVDLILINWSREAERFPNGGHRLSVIYAKAHRMTKAAQPGPRIPDERDSDTAYWRELAESTARPRPRREEREIDDTAPITWDALVRRSRD